MARKYSWYDWLAVAGLTYLMLPGPEDALTGFATAPPSFVGGLAGLTMFYPDVLKQLGL